MAKPRCLIYGFFCFFFYNSQLTWLSPCVSSKLVTTAEHTPILFEKEMLGKTKMNISSMVFFVFSSTIFTAYMAKPRCLIYGFLCFFFYNSQLTWLSPCVSSKLVTTAEHTRILFEKEMLGKTKMNISSMVFFVFSSTIFTAYMAKPTCLI